MPNVAFQGTDLHITLSAGEKLASLHGDLVIPLRNIIGAEVLGPKWWTGLGLRVPGTGLPGLVVAGTYKWKGDNAFVSWTRGNQVLQINLTGHQYNRVVVGVPDAEEWVDTITMYLTSC
jgi:hypothetical protein